MRIFWLLALILAGAALSCSSYERSPRLVNPVQLGITLDVEPRVALADGATSIRVRVVLPSGTPASASVVTLRVVGDAFENGVASVTSHTDENVTVGTFVAPRRPGMARVLAVTEAGALEDSVVFDTAFPERIEVEPDLFLLPTDNPQTTLTVVLTRSTGRSSQGIRPTLQAQDTTGVAVGQFGRVIEADGSFRCTYTVVPDAYAGRIALIATAPANAASSVIADTTTVVR